MTQTLKAIAAQLKAPQIDVQMIYAFNGSGKTRLSKELQELIDPKPDDEETEAQPLKFLYYSAFTEDLFYWDNDLNADRERILRIQPHKYTHEVFQTSWLEHRVTGRFQRYTNTELTPVFRKDYSELTFSIQGRNEERKENIKISKGEESIFIWSIFSCLLEDLMDPPDTNDRAKDQYKQLEYVFVDDPVTSLDENHLIQLAVDIAQLIKSRKTSESTNPALKFILTTHSPLFYNIAYNELGLKQGYILRQLEDGQFQFEWTDLLDTVEGDQEAYYRRIITYSSHSTLMNGGPVELEKHEKQTVKFLLDHVTQTYGRWHKPHEEKQNAQNV